MPPAFSEPHLKRLFAFLVIERSTPVTREDIAAVIWPGSLPAQWEIELDDVLARLRAVLLESGLGREALPRVMNTYQLRLRPQTWIDVDAALSALGVAEAAIAADQPHQAYASAGIAIAIGRRGFLDDQIDGWSVMQRDRLQAILYRGLDCFAAVFNATLETDKAIAAAEEMLQIEPYREAGFRRLMLAYLNAGERARARAVYEDCCDKLLNDLGVAPSPKTVALYEAALVRNAA